MMLDLTDEERELLVELLETRYKTMLHEIHHTDTYEYKRLLQQKANLIEKLREKMENLHP